MFGLTEFRDFERAVKSGFIPKPDFVLDGGKRRWTNASLDPLLSKDREMVESAVRQKNIENRVLSGENAPPPRPKKQRR
ncbi:MAG: hypothetical protein KDG54_18840 [Geminicoccaceae bacterium]|nr:hypothetical protein [Geminicoccaceae bacterium]